nr:MAG TPA: hypothetical protein [Caudoviricetes sp.]
MILFILILINHIYKALFFYKKVSKVSVDILIPNKYNKIIGK